MEENKREGYMSVSPRDIDDLKAIYEDYLYMVRKHELVFACETIDGLYIEQFNSMYPEFKNFRNVLIPWGLSELKEHEKQEFIDYTNNDMEGDGRKAYVFLQHVKSEENNGKKPVFAIAPYKNITIAPQMPSMIERYTLSVPEGATLGNTMFYVDGRYKIGYLGNKLKDTSLSDCSNADLLDEIIVMLNLGECYRHHGYKTDDKFGKEAIEIYAGEILATNENNLLEILSSFAEKVRYICHKRYHEEDGLADIRKAQEKGFLNLPDNFTDYMNIRNLLRHQWDTLNDLDDFSPEKSRENKRVRAERVNSYLKFCDKRLHQRMESCIEALHHMQQIIGALDPTWIIRDKNESKNKFVQRIKEASRQFPDREIKVEINLPLADKKREFFNETLHKKKIFPNIRIVDDFTEDNDKYELMEEYKERSLFLRSFHSIESFAMELCQIRGKDKNNRNAWFYLQDIGVITPEECQVWQDYITLRNDLAHKYFDANLRNQLRDSKEKYFKDFEVMKNKLYKSAPIVRKIQDNVYEYEHLDGSVATLNHLSHERKVLKQPVKGQRITEPRSVENGSDRKLRRESYRNGIEFKIDDKKIVGVKLPNDVYINMTNRSINWGDRTRWYSNAERFNVLQTPRSTIRTDKELRITSFFEENHKVPFRGGDSLLVDYRHGILLDNAGRIKEFKFKDAGNNIVKTEFKHTNNDQDLIMFADGTSVLLSGEGITLIHDNKVLSYENRKEFAKTYDISPISLQQTIKHGNGR